MEKWGVKIKSFLILFSTFMLVVFYQNCSKPVSQSSYIVSGLTEQDIAASKATLVLQTKCASCHNAENPSGGIDVTSMDRLLAAGHVIPTEPNLSPLFVSIQQGRMPPVGSLSQDEITDVAGWISSMTNDTPVNLPPGSEILPLAANFKSIKQNILDKRCLGCHNVTNARGGVNYSTYTSTMNTVQRGVPSSSSLYTSIAVRNTMPQGAGGSLSADEKRVVMEWITAGAADN